MTHSFINRAQAGIFLLMVICPILACLWILDAKINTLNKMMDGAVQGLIVNHSSCGCP